MKITPNVEALLAYIRPHGGRLLQAAVAMTVLAAMRGAIVYVVGPVIEGIFNDKNMEMLRLIVIGLPVIFVLKAVADYITSYLINYVGQKTVQKMRDDLFTRVHQLSMEFHWRKRSSEVMSRVINDLANVQSAIQSVPLYLIRDLFTVVALIGVLFYLNWRFAAISVIIMPAAAALLRVLSKKMRRSSTRAQATMGHISHRFQESLQGMTVVKAFNYEDRAIARFRRSNDDFFSETMRFLRASALSSPLMELLGNVMLILMIYMGGLEVMAGRMTSADFLSFMAAFFTAYMPLKNIASLNTRVQMGLASWDRVKEILDEKPDVPSAADPVRLGDVRGTVEFRGVTYKYPSRDTVVLKNLSFSVGEGEVAAFVGPSGSGKSTIIHLLLRFFDPVSGTVLLDGKDLRDLDPAELRDATGLVTQDTVLFDDDVNGNLTIGRPEATEAEIREAAEAANAHPFIEAMPQG
ncbi:MAG: ABC transporter ATP-binding protein, partial [Elusimicrobiales bacterium]|nr:ABC transporter ATP-binding protein [Elusimicrobiales bacterium]